MLLRDGLSLTYKAAVRVTLSVMLLLSAGGTIYLSSVTSSVDMLSSADKLVATVGRVTNKGQGLLPEEFDKPTYQQEAVHSGSGGIRQHEGASDQNQGPAALECLKTLGNQEIANPESEALLTKLQQKLGRMSDELEASQLRYYMYDDPILVRKDFRDSIRRGGGRALMMKRYGAYGIVEIQMYEALENHPQRTFDTTQADLYIIPIGLTMFLTQSRNLGPDLSKALETVYNTSTFQETMGHRHVILVQALPVYSYGHRQNIPGLQPHYPRLWNVTIGKDHNQEGTFNLFHSVNNTLSDDVYRDALKYKKHYMSRSGFAMGLYSPFSKDVYSPGFLPLMLASYCKFLNTTVDFFYRTRTAGSLNNSTRFRHALVTNETIDALPKSSIGFDIEKEQWEREYPWSKYCFVIRGDSPHSRALLRSVRVGCIPVIVSDFYPYFSPTLRQSISMDDYAIIIDEATFLKDPLAATRAVEREMEGPYKIQAKLEGLAFSQRLFFPDHPQSLFVPALLREAYKGWKAGIDHVDYKTGVEHRPPALSDDMRYLL
jgi:hypothetical protein